MKSRGAPEAGSRRLLTAEALRRGGGVLVVGDVLNDIVVIPDGPLRRGTDQTARILMSAGGSGANQAVWLASTGRAVRFAGRVGASDLTRWHDHFAGHGVEAVLAADEAAPSGSLVCIVEPSGERSFLTERGANLNLGGADLTEALLAGCSVLLVSGYALFASGPRRAVLDLVGKARALGMIVVVDAASTGFLSDVGPKQFIAWTKGSDLLLANEDEAVLLAGSAIGDEQFARLGEAYGLVVIKRGARGAMAGDRGGRIAQATGEAVVMRDSTGAGDAFAAGFVARSLAENGDIADALVAGNWYGARAVEEIGAQPSRRFKMMDPRSAEWIWWQKSSSAP